MKRKDATIQDFLQGVSYTLLVFDFDRESTQFAFHYRVLPQLMYDGTINRAKVATKEPERIKEIARELGGELISEKNF